MEFSLAADRPTVGVAIDAKVMTTGPETALVVRFADGDVRRLPIARTGELRAVFARFAAPGDAVAFDASVDPASRDAWIEAAELLAIAHHTVELSAVSGEELTVRREERANETSLAIAVRRKRGGAHRAIVRLPVRPADPLAFFPSTVAAFVDDRPPVTVELRAPFPECALDVTLETGRESLVRIVGTEPFAVGEPRCRPEPTA